MSLNRLIFLALTFVCGTAFAANLEVPMDEELLAPHPMGAVGLFHTFSAQRRNPGPHSFTFSLTSTYFNLKSFPAAGSEIEKLTGRAALSYTPVSPFEAFVAGWGFTSNDSSDAQSIQQVGNLDYGVKLASELLENRLSAGGLFIGHFQKAVADRNINRRAYSYDILGVLTWDLLKDGVPFRVHMNGGYRWDRTSHFVTAATSERDRILLGAVARNSVLASLGFEAPLSPFVFGVEYSTEQTLDTPGVGFSDNPQRVTLGVRYFPMKDGSLALEMAGDLGFFATDEASRIIREPKYNLLFGATYTFGVISRKPEEQLKVASLPTGTLAGQVTEAGTQQPVANARIKLCSSDTSAIVSDKDQGSFHSYPLPPGECPVTVLADGYNSVSEVVTILVNQTVTHHFSLQRSDPTRGVVMIQVRTPDGKPVKASITIPELPQAPPTETDDAGTLRLRLPTGVYHLEARLPEGSKGSNSIEVVENQDVPVEITIEQKFQPRAKLDKSQIYISNQIQFAPSTMDLTENSKKVLDEVAALLAAHPEIRKVEISGHTDSSGPADVNKRLSQLRAEAVRNYLIASGVPKEKLVAIGYGLEKPLGSNATKEGRLSNRRVDFRILEKL